MKLNKILNNWKEVFTNWKYVASTIIIALLFYFFNVLISSWNSLISFYPAFGFFGTIKFFFTLLIGFKETIKLHSFVSLIIISLLFGMLFSLVGYKVNMGRGNEGKKVGFFGGIGLFLAVLAPGCAACGVGLVSLFGISAGFLSFLPYEGLELSILSIIILSYTIITVTKNLYVCKLKDLNTERRLMK